MASSRIGNMILDSDGVEEMFCEHCEKDHGKIIAAEGFCEDCLDFMCVTCVRFHMRYKSDHMILDKYCIPEDFCKGKCKTHPKEIVKFYCTVCKTAVCSECKKIGHRKNCYFEFLPGLVSNEDFDTRLNELKEKVESLTNTLDKHEQAISSNLAQVSKTISEADFAIERQKNKLSDNLQEQRREILENMDRKREAILKQLDREKAFKIYFLDKQKAMFEKSLEEAQEKLRRESFVKMGIDERKIRLLGNRTISVKSDLDKVKEDINRTNTDTTAGKKCGQFLAIMKAQEDISRIEKDSVHIMNENHFNAYVFRSGECRIDIESENSGVELGKLVKDSKVRRDVMEVNRLNAVVKLKKKKTNVSVNVIDLCKISDNRLIAVDGDNKSLVLIDIDTNRYVLGLTLSSQPEAVTKMEENKIAVALPSEKKIQFVFITTQGEFIPKDVVSLEFRCSAIAYNSPNLFVTAENAVHVINICVPVSRRIVNVINIEPSRGLLETCSKRIVINSKLKTIYLTEGDIVKSIDFDGKRLNESPSLGGAVNSLAIDSSGALFVGVGCKGVYQLSTDLDVVDRLVKVRVSHCLYLCTKEEKLYIGTYGKIYVFKID